MVMVTNLMENDKAFIFLMDYPNRKRIKIWGTARYVEDDQDVLVQLIATANGSHIGPPPNHRGRSPATVVAVVRRIGRKRRCAASTIARGGSSAWS